LSAFETVDTDVRNSATRVTNSGSFAMQNLTIIRL
jgi:hypothetical protein